MTFFWKITFVIVVSIALIPVCSVIAEKNGISYVVSAPVVTQFDSRPSAVISAHDEKDRIKVTNVVLSSGAGTSSTDLDSSHAIISRSAEDRINVQHVVLSSDRVENEKYNGPHYSATLAAASLPQASRSEKDGLKVADSDFHEKSIKKRENKSAKNINNSSITKKSLKKISQSPKTVQETDYISSSGGVSIFPGDRSRIRKENVSEDGGFFSTPKRMLGLSGNKVKIKPSLSIVETYDSNIDYKKISDLVSTYKPSLTLDVLNDDSKFNFRGDFIYRDYFKHSELDRYDYNLMASGKYFFNPVLDAGVTLEHKRRHNLDQNTAEVGAVQLDPSIILSTVVTPELNWTLAPRDKIRVVYSLDKTDYERATDSDYINHSLSTVWAHAMRDERTTFFIGQLGVLTHYTREMDDLTGDQYSVQAVFGVDHAFTESLNFSLKGGPGVTFSNYSTDYNRDNSVDSMYQFRAELGYRRPKYEIVPSVERLVRPGRYGENEIMDRAQIFFRYKFTERFVQNFVGTYWLLEGEGVNTSEEHKSRGIFFQSVTNWDFDEDWRLFVGFNFNDNRNRITDKTNQRVKTWVGLSYAFPTELR